MYCIGVICIKLYLMSGAADDGGEDSSGSIVTGEPGLAHTGAVVNNQSSNIIIHGCGLCR